MADDDRTVPTREPQVRPSRSRRPGRVAGDLGEGTPANVDVHKLGQEDRPQEDWGEPAAEGATFSANHARRTGREAGQGSKTRLANKDIVSRRS